MNGFAPLLAAIALAQEPAPAAPPAGKPAGTATGAEPAAVDAGRAAPRPEPPPPPAPAQKATRAPAPATSTTGPETTAPAATPTATRTPSRPPDAPPRAGQQTVAPAGHERATASDRAGDVAADPTAKASPAGTSPEAQGAPAERLSRAFADALARGDAEALTALCAERFSFDGDLRSGREAVRRTWRALLAGRPAVTPTLGRIEVMSISDAVARHGRPPSRIASLARPGTLVAIVDVGGRTVVLLLAREGGRLAVAGMHD